MIPFNSLPDDEGSQLIAEFQRLWREHGREIERYRLAHGVNDESLVQRLAQEREDWWATRGIDNPFRSKHQ